MVDNRIWGLAATAIIAMVLLIITGPPTSKLKLSVLLAGAKSSFGETHAHLNSGYDIPLLGWGSFHASAEDSVAAVQAAVKAGFRHVDTAKAYGNEEGIGSGFQQLFQEGSVTRQDLFVTSKLWNSDHAPSDVLPALQTSLSKLKLEYLDLYLIHWPSSQEAGPEVVPPFNETWTAMEDLVHKGLVKSIGVSNFSPEKIQALLETATIRPAVNQVEVHCHWRNDRTIEWCKNEGIHVTAYAPLSSPQTMSLEKKDVPNLLKDKQVAAIAAKHSKTAAQTLLRWGLQHGTSVIPKSTNPEHCQENQGAWGWQLPEEDYDALSNMDFQLRYFDGGFVMDKDGPYRTYEDLWNEPKP